MVNMLVEMVLCEVVICVMFGDECLFCDVLLNMMFEDFGFMLEEWLGVYVLIGNV